MKTISLTFLSLLLFASFALADADDAKNLGIRTDRIDCTIDFHSAVMQSIAGKVDQASSLNTFITKLQSDQAQLKSLAESGERKAFEDYLRDNLHPDMKSADEAVRDLRKNYKSYNITKGVRESLKDSYKSAQDSFKKCVSQNDLKVSQHRADYYNKVLDKHQEQVNKLAKRSVNTAELSSIISQARTTILDPLDNAVKSGDAAQAQDALKQYCLWNGCKKGINFHFAAKFEQARLSALLEKITPMANKAGLSSDVSAVQTQIDVSKSALNAVGTSDLTKETSDQIWEPLKSALKAFKTLMKDLKVTK